jgi:hypothetical protein
VDLQDLQDQKQLEELVVLEEQKQVVVEMVEIHHKMLRKDKILLIKVEEILVQMEVLYLLLQLLVFSQIF